MSKICSNCEFNNDKNAKFCLKCGNSLESNNTQEKPLNSKPDVGNNNIDQGDVSITSEPNHSNEVNCPYCGGSINVTAEKCRYCGEWVKKRQSQPYNPHDNDGKTYTLAIVLGYIFTLLGGWIGLIIAIYLLTRDNKDAKTHGKIQLVLFFIMVILWIMIIP